MTAPMSRIRQRFRQPLDRTGLDDRIVVQEEDRVGRRDRGAGVARAGEAAVRGEHERFGIRAQRQLARSIVVRRRCVIDDDHAPYARIAWYERIEAASCEFPPPVSRDDDVYGRGHRWHCCRVRLLYIYTCLVFAKLGIPGTCIRT